jgi:hypothetical protein
VIAFNGFDDEAELSDYRNALAGIPHESLIIRPPTQDIPAYFTAARILECQHLCFFNSYSVLLDGDWLAKMYEHARRDGVGVVGASGSWQSGYSYVLFEHGRPSAYTELLQDYPSPGLPIKRKLFMLSDELQARIRRKSFHRRLISRLYYYGLVAPFYWVTNGVRYSLKDRIKHLREERATLRTFFANFELFPAPHVRTNAFMIRRELMLGFQRVPILNKFDAYRFESGKEGMTSQILRAGLRTLVVGRDGRAYDPDQWHLSETLWQGEQQNLLVSDNQTNDYAHGSPRRRVFLSRVAWGDKALPSLPPSVSCARDDEQIGAGKISL